MEKTTTSYEGKGANSFFLFKRNLLTLTQFSEQTHFLLSTFYYLLSTIYFLLSAFQTRFFHSSQQVEDVLYTFDIVYHQHEIRSYIFESCVFDL